MDDDEFKEDDDDIHKVGIDNKNFHSVDKKTLRLIMIQVLVIIVQDYQLI